MLFPNNPICSSPNSTTALGLFILIAFIFFTSFSFSLHCRKEISCSAHEQGCKTAPAFSPHAVPIPECRNHGPE